MLRFTRSVTRWLLAAFAVSVVLAWPLHEAQHIGEAPGAHAVAALGDSAPADGDEAAADTCLWCLVHADQALLPGSPPELRFHAEASTPPASLGCGQPTGRCALAAQPRGPPQA